MSAALRAVARPLRDPASRLQTIKHTRAWAPGPNEPGIPSQISRRASITHLSSKSGALSFAAVCLRYHPPATETPVLRHAPTSDPTANDRSRPNYDPQTLVLHQNLSAFSRTVHRTAGQPRPHAQQRLTRSPPTRLRIRLQAAPPPCRHSQPPVRSTPCFI